MKFKLLIISITITMWAAISAAENLSLVSFAPYINFERNIASPSSSLEGSAENCENEFKHPTMLTVGLRYEKSHFFSSLNGTLPWSDGESLPFCLDANLGVKYKQYSIYLGKFTDLKSAKEHEVLSPYYAGLEFNNNRSDFWLQLNAQYQFGDYRQPNLDCSSASKTHDYNTSSFTTKLSYHLKIFSPYLKFSIEKWNFEEKFQTNIALGISFLNSSRAKCESPRQVTYRSSGDLLVRKPNIYLYPPKPGRVKVAIGPNGRITTSIPAYDEGWDVYVEPNGLINGEYGFLFYEAEVSIEDVDEGWCVSDPKSFYKTILKEYGFSEIEIKDFVDYWTKHLPKSPYYLIKPLLNDELENICPLEISPAPDNILRLWFVFKPSQEKVELVKPGIPDFNRTGFVATEWGGLIID